MIDIKLVFEYTDVVGVGEYPVFIQFPRTEGQLFFINEGLMFGIPSKRLNGNFSAPVWLDGINVSPKEDINMSNLELRTIGGYGIVGSYKTKTSQKLLINEYLIKMDRYLESGSIKYSMDSPIASFTMKLENPINENPEHHGNVAISEESSLLSPGSKVVFELSMGDSEGYPMGSFYVDRSNFSLLNETILVDGRNVIGKALKDQTFDERNIYPYNNIREILKEILLRANIIADEILIEDSSIYSGYKFDCKMTYLDGIIEILKAFDDWRIRELVDGTVVIGSYDYGKYKKNSSYVFRRNKDIYSRDIVKDDQDAYRRVCIHNQDYSIKVYKDVETYVGWNLQSNKTLYINVPNGTSLVDARNYANQITNNLQYVGKIENFKGPFRPQLILGDEAIIVDDKGTQELGLITEINHQFGKEGFYTDFTVDSGGVVGKGRLGDYINQITRERKTSSRTYE